MGLPPQDYLRISVTDRCNYRCAYCLPNGQPPGRPRDELLTYEEHLAAAAAVHSAWPLAKVRLTGGEPLLRKDLSRLVEMLAGLDPRPHLALTTHGEFLEAALPGLVAAGLDSVNVSMDHPDPTRFREMTGGGDLGRVLAGMRAAKAAGLAPVRVNAVVTRDTLHDLGLMVDFAVREGVDLRLIEMMPFPDNASYHAEQAVPAAEIDRALAGLVGDDGVAPPQRGAGPARDRRIAGAASTAGVIAAASDPGCDRCSRLRISSSGRLSVCLYELEGRDLKPWLRPLDEEGLGRAIRAAAAGKRTHNPLFTGGTTIHSLSLIGG